jgi:hypothetical protein
MSLGIAVLSDAFRKKPRARMKEPKLNPQVTDVAPKGRPRAASVRKSSLACQMDDRARLSAICCEAARDHRNACGTRRYKPPVRMIKLTEQREITPYKWGAS